MTNERELRIFKDIQKLISNHGAIESVLMCAVELLQHHQKRIDELMEKPKKREPITDEQMRSEGWTYGITDTGQRMFFWFASLSEVNGTVKYLHRCYQGHLVDFTLRRKFLWYKPQREFEDAGLPDPSKWPLVKNTTPRTPKGEMESPEDAFKRRGWFNPGHVVVGAGRVGVYELYNPETKRQFREELFAGDYFSQYYWYKKTRNPDIPKPRMKRTAEVTPVGDRWYVVRERESGDFDFVKTWLNDDGHIMGGGMDPCMKDAREYYEFLAEVPGPEKYLEKKEESK